METVIKLQGRVIALLDELIAAKTDHTKEQLLRLVSDMESDSKLFADRVETSLSNLSERLKAMDTLLAAHILAYNEENKKRKTGTVRKG